MTILNITDTERELRKEIERLTAERDAAIADAKRYQFAMDWNQKQFAICMRDGMSWTPVKTDGPIDFAMKGEQS